MDGGSCRLEMPKEKVNECEDRAVENTQPEQRKASIFGGNIEKDSSNIQDNIQKSQIYVTGVSEGGKRETEVEENVLRNNGPHFTRSGERYKMYRFKKLSKSHKGQARYLRLLH